LSASVRCALGIAALGVECLVLLLVLHDPVAAAQLTLTWADAVGATQYLVEREDISLGLFAEIARIGADATSYADTAVLPSITYCYRLRAASAAGYSDYSNVACGAAAAGVGFFDDFSRPDASAGQWLDDGRRHADDPIRPGAERQVKMMHTAIRPACRARTVSASFISVDNNLGPRFALVVRYKDPGTTTCYRQTGGSSALRISRVVGGVETVLRSYTLESGPGVGLHTWMPGPRHHADADGRCRQARGIRRNVVARQRGNVRGVPRRRNGSRPLADRGQLQGYGAVGRRPLLPRWLRLRRTRRAPAILFGGGPDHVTGNRLRRP
jgi:hypothetical protein